jgi:hypothetical protein
MGHHGHRSVSSAFLRTKHHFTLNIGLDYRSETALYGRNRRSIKAGIIQLGHEFLGRGVHDDMYQYCFMKDI